MCGVCLIYPVATNPTVAYWALQTRNYKCASSTLWDNVCLFWLVWVTALSNLRPDRSIYVKFGEDP